jgi:hypothetical protein
VLLILDDGLKLCGGKDDGISACEEKDGFECGCEEEMTLSVRIERVTSESCQHVKF